jgi:hypothetical protein
VSVWQTQSRQSRTFVAEFKVHINDWERAPHVDRLGLTGGDQPIFLKQLIFDPTVWKTYIIRLLMEFQSRNMLKLLHQWMEFPYFFFLISLQNISLILLDYWKFDYRNIVMLYSIWIIRMVVMLVNYWLICVQKIWFFNSTLIVVCWLTAITNNAVFRVHDRKMKENVLLMYASIKFR